MVIKNFFTIQCQTIDFHFSPTNDFLLLADMSFVGGVEASGIEAVIADAKS